MIPVSSPSASDAGRTDPRALGWLITVFAFPLFANLIATSLPVEIVLINFLVAMGFHASIGPRTEPLNETALAYLEGLCYSFIVIGIVNFLREGSGIMMLLAKHYGAIIAAGAIRFFRTVPSASMPRVLIRWANAVGIMFVLQLLFSIYESVTATDYLINSYDWNTSKIMSGAAEASDLVDRLQISYFFQMLHVPFNITFTGILGQHNHWGTQLPFYFLLFGYAYFTFPAHRRKFLVLMVLTAFGSVMNTSRFGIIAIMVSSGVFFFLLSDVKRSIKRSIVITVILAFGLSWSTLYDTIEIYIRNTDTFSSRIDTWNIIQEFIFTRGSFSLLFGSSATEISQMTLGLVWADFENLGFTFIFERGIPFLVAFVVWLVIVVRRSSVLGKVERIFVRLAVADIVLVSLWNNTFMRYSGLGIATVLLTILFLMPRTNQNLVHESLASARPNN